jgi:hypothetical protein
MTGATKLPAPRIDGFTTHRGVAHAYAEADYKAAPFARNRRPLTLHGRLADPLSSATDWDDDPEIASRGRP